MAGGQCHFLSFPGLFFFFFFLTLMCNKSACTIMSFDSQLGIIDSFC